MGQPRLLSFTEVQTAMTCWAQWDFAYGGRLAGSTLKPKGIAPILSEGRAWGAAVAAWHANQGTLLASFLAHEALRASLDADAATMAEQGIPLDVETRVETETRLSGILDHYMMTAEPLPNLTQLEGEIIVAVPSRGGKNASTKYRFQCFLDGFTAENGQEWIVEFKLRGSLTAVPLIFRQRQPRWYAWSFMRKHGRAPTGVLVEERLNELPKPPRIVNPPSAAWKKRIAELIRIDAEEPMGMTASDVAELKRLRETQGRVPSSAMDQLCTWQAYIDVCHEYGVEPKADVVEHLRSRVWQQRVPIPFRPSEMLDAGAELRDAAKLIRDLDNGQLTPIRNATRAHCSSCKFREVCAEPQDDIFVDAKFERTVPKRLREPKTEEETVSA